MANNINNLGSSISNSNSYYTTTTMGDVMYFFKIQGRQYLDLTGNLILSYNDKLIKSRSTSAAPHKALNAKYVINAGGLNLLGKYMATMLALKFIWGKPAPLLECDTGKKEPYIDPDKEKQLGIDNG